MNLIKKLFIILTLSIFLFSCWTNKLNTIIKFYNDWDYKNVIQTYQEKDLDWLDWNNEKLDIIFVVSDSYSKEWKLKESINFAKKWMDLYWEDEKLYNLILQNLINEKIFDEISSKEVLNLGLKYSNQAMKKYPNNEKYSSLNKDFIDVKKEILKDDIELENKKNEFLESIKAINN